MSVDKDLQFRQDFRNFMEQRLILDFKWYELRKMLEQEIEIQDIKEYKLERKETEK